MKRKNLVACFLLFVAFSSFSQIPQILSYQGMLNKPDGEYKFTFKLYDAATEGNLLWTEQKTLQVREKLFSTALGDVTPFGPSVKFDKPYWLGISIGEDPELTPRIALTSVAYSLNSLRADTARVAKTSTSDSTWQHNGKHIFYTSGRIGIGTSTPATNLHVSSSYDACIDISSTHQLGSYLRLAAVASNDRQESQIGFRGILRIYSPAVSDKANVLMTISDGGIVDILGRTRTQVLEITGGSDLAEPFEMSNDADLPAGALVVIDKDNPGKLKLATEPYDKRVAGVISGAGGINPGLTLNQEGLTENGQHVALSGKVYALASTCNGPIEPGDLLTTSNVPGYAMKATNQKRWPGAVIGKAMNSLKGGDGLVLVLIQPN